MLPLKGGRDAVPAAGSRRTLQPGSTRTPPAHNGASAYPVTDYTAGGKPARVEMHLEAPRQTPAFSPAGGGIFRAAFRFTRDPSLRRKSGSARDDAPGNQLKTICGRDCGGRKLSAVYCDSRCSTSRSISTIAMGAKFALPNCALSSANCVCLNCFHSAMEAFAC